MVKSVANQVTRIFKNRTKYRKFWQKVDDKAYGVSINGSRRSLVVSALASINVVLTLDPVSTWMGDRMRAGKPKPSQYVTSHPGQLSLPSLRGR